MSSCPQCGNDVPALRHVDAGLRLRAKDAGVDLSHEEICDNCFRDITRNVSKGAILRKEKEAKEQNKLMLWRSRSNLVKQAKALMIEKSFSEAAVQFEKYLRVLEIVYEAKPGELKPDHFKHEARHQELTVIASVYWDLMRIYDSNSRYSDRQKKAAEKLADFARFTPIYANLVRQAEVQSRSANNTDAYRHFLKKSNAQRPRCFIATAAYDGQRTPTVHTLCLWRDHVLRRSRPGRTCVFLYYTISPPLARWLDTHPTYKPLFRKALNLVAVCVDLKFSLNPHRE